MLKTAVVLILMTIGLTTSMESQMRINRPQEREVVEDEKWSDRIFFGGGLSVGFFNGWNIYAGPNVGYRVTEDFWAGLGLDYYFISYNDLFGDRYSTHVFGPKVFALYYVTPEINLASEFSNYYYKLLQLTPNNRLEEQKFQQQRLLVGGGYTQWFSRRGGIRLELLYDVLYDESNPNFINQAFVPRVNVFF